VPRQIAQVAIRNSAATEAWPNIVVDQPHITDPKA
jgi:hypothetical protein